MINQPLPSLIMPFFPSNTEIRICFIKSYFSRLISWQFSVFHAQLEVEIVTESLQLPKCRNSYRSFLGRHRNSYLSTQQQLPIVKIVSKIVGIVTAFHYNSYLFQLQYVRRDNQTLSLDLIIIESKKFIKIQIQLANILP